MGLANYQEVCPRCDRITHHRIKAAGGLTVIDSAKAETWRPGKAIRLWVCTSCGIVFASQADWINL